MWPFCRNRKFPPATIVSYRQARRQVITKHEGNLPLGMETSCPWQGLG